MVHERAVARRVARASAARRGLRHARGRIGASHGHAAAAGIALPKAVDDILDAGLAVPRGCRADRARAVRGVGTGRAGDAGPDGGIAGSHARLVLPDPGRADRIAALVILSPAGRAGGALAGGAGLIAADVAWREDLLARRLHALLDAGRAGHTAERVPEAIASDGHWPIALAGAGVVEAASAAAPAVYVLVAGTAVGNLPDDHLLAGVGPRGAAERRAAQRVEAGLNPALVDRRAA